MDNGLVCLLLVVLIVLLALVLVRGAARAGPGPVAPRGAGGALGGALGGVLTRPRRPCAPRIYPSSPTPARVQCPPHPIEDALLAYARSLGSRQRLVAHPLCSGRYEPLRPARAGGGTTAPGPAWDHFASWDELGKDELASAAYFAQRTAVLNKPDLDWGPVLADMNPKLEENREYIGVARLDPDGRTLRIRASEASPLVAGTLDSKTKFAGVTAELVEKYASLPGLFLFHTHPADPRGSPLPSSNDLSAAILFGAVSRFAACAVISRYGVLVHGLAWGGYKAINGAKDWKAAALSLSHDVVAAHEAIRSWSTHTLAEYFAFYPRHRLLLFAYPSSELVGDMQRSYLWDLESPIAHDLIDERAGCIAEHAGSVAENAGKVAPCIFGAVPD